jgi:hypothetical protein
MGAQLDCRAGAAARPPRMGGDRPEGRAGDRQGVFAQILLRLFRPQNKAHLKKPEDLTGNFNSLLEDRVLVFADDATWTSTAIQHWPPTLGAHGREKGAGCCAPSPRACRTRSGWRRGAE